MDCQYCSSQLVAVEEAFFYVKGEKDVSLAIKPEFEATVLQKKTVNYVTESKKKVRVKCGACNTNVGSVIPFGPGGTRFYAFGLDKVKLGGRTMNKSQRWWNSYKEFPMIETRDSNNFFNVLKTNINTEDVKKENKPLGNIVFPALSNLSDFEWYSVSLVKQPKIYQIEAFIEVLQRNLIVVIKTGAGKTLIASMFLGRMCSLNPDRMGLMIVDRIPLVFQQGDAIHHDTNLRVARICGENKTFYKIKQLNEGIFDIIVVTAGAFVEMVQKKQIDINLFCAVVFDECHHVAGSHKYVDCLKLFTKKALLEQPRILGLSASLFNAETLTQAENRLGKYMANFPNGKIYHPSLPQSKLLIQRKTVTLTTIQKDLIKQIVGKVNEIVHWLCQVARIPVSTMQLQDDLLNAYKVKGDLRALAGEYSSIPNFDQQIRICHILMEAIELCATLGVPIAWKLLEDNKLLTEIGCFYNKIDSFSNRLKELKSLLVNTKADSKVLVFVSTRNVARELFNCLEEFSSFHMGKVFGHGGYDGMSWEGEQECIIEEFRTGSCNLLICTSVLEEGLDVSACDLVVCFSGIKSLIQFIQIRGRARKENSQFIVFQTEEENQKNNKIHAKEEMLSTVLKLNQQAYCYFSDLTRDIIKKIEQQMMYEGSASSDIPIAPINSSERKKEFTFNVYADVKDGIDVNKVKNQLLQILEEYQDFRINRLEIITGESDISPKVVTTFLVGAICHSVSTENAYLNFCRSFDFQIKFERFTSHVWSRQNVNITDRVDSATRVKCNEYGVGFLKNKISAVITKVLDKQVEIEFTPRKHIKIIYYDIHTVIPLASLGKFALISPDLHTLKLIIPLKYPPCIYRHSKKGDKRLSIDDIDELNYFSNNPVLFLTFDINKISQIKQITSSKTLFPVYTFDVNMKFDVDDTLVEKTVNVNNTRGVHDILYTIKCLEDSRVMCFPSNFSEVDHIKASKSNSEMIDLVQLVMDKVYDVAMKSHYFSDLKMTFSNIYKEYSNFPVNMRESLRLPIPINHYVLKRVVVTPSRLVVLPAVPIASNRLLRKLKETDQYAKYEVLILAFKDEDMSKLTEVSVYRHVHLTLIRGIDINGIKYRFLLSSGSQLRAHKAYFISAATYEEVLNVRSSIIPNSNKFNSSAQYLSRLGQYGTADKFVEKISKDNISWIEDIKAANGDLTTDGSGKISMSLASCIIDQPEKLPSAFQVRYSGVKGILVSCPDIDPDFRDKQICLRKSMKKFSNEDEDLCIVGVSKIFELTLNREVITLLSAIKCDWFLSNTLMNYQEKALVTFANIFIDGGAAREALINHMPKFFINALKSHNFNIIEEKYWFKILQGIYRLQVNLLKSKTNIPIDKGCVLIGVPDPAGVLEEGEVFVQLKRDDCDIEVLCEPALIYRNPCLHPGDHRRVNCVYKKELTYLHNVIVMPTKNCTFSLSSACSGGDLDGDKFGIIWDPKLVPDKEFIFPPCDYSSLSKVALPASPASQPKTDNLTIILERLQELQNSLINSSSGMSVDKTDNVNNCIDRSDGSDLSGDRDLANFYVKFMANDCLGKIAHKHLALCDILDDGARDPMAIEMAKSQAQAVDYPKTDVLPEVPKDALGIVEGIGFPDFMEKAVAETYPSKKILGHLFRRCVSICYNFELSSKCDIDILMNTNLIVVGNEDYLEEAAKVYKNYADNMEMVMVKFDLKVEADVVLGCATFGWGVHYQDNIGKTTDAIVASYNAIVIKYRKLFFSNVNDLESQMKKASAWYRITNDPSIKVNYVHIQNEKFVSFPWVVYDILCDIMAKQNRKQPSRVNFCIGKSTLELFKKNANMLNKNISEKMKVMKDIENSIDRLAKENFKLNKGFLVNLYGSTSIYVCEPESDVDICVYPTSKAYDSLIIPSSQRDCFEKLEDVEKEKHFLKLVVSPAVDRIVSSKREYFDRKHPIVKCISGDSENPISCDVSMSEVGMRKTLYIQHLYQIDACYLPLFWVLVRWARVTGVVKSVDEGSSPIMDTADFYALIIHILNCPRQLKCQIEKPRRSTDITFLYRRLDKVRFEEIHSLGKMIFTFFQKASNLNDNLQIQWPAPKIPITKLDQSDLEKVSVIANSSFHFLAATRDVTNLHSHYVSNSKQIKELEKVLPLSISYAIGKAHAYHAARLTQMTGAIVTIELPEGKQNLLLKAEGTQMAINNLRSEMRLLLTTNKALVLGRLPNDTSRYFMEGSSILLVMGNSSIKSLCEFKPSFGPYELIHHAHIREMLLLKQKTMEDSWEEKVFERFFAHISKQMEMLPKDNEELKQSIEITSRFGCFYLVNRADQLPVSQSSINIQELQYSMEKGRRSRKSWRRGEYRSQVIKDKMLYEEDPRYLSLLYFL